MYCISILHTHIWSTIIWNTHIYVVVTVHTISKNIFVYACILIHFEVSIVWCSGVSSASRFLNSLKVLFASVTVYKKGYIHFQKILFLMYEFLSRFLVSIFLNSMNLWIYYNILWRSYSNTFEICRFQNCIKFDSFWMSHFASIKIQIFLKNLILIIHYKLIHFEWDLN